MHSRAETYTSGEGFSPFHKRKRYFPNGLSALAHRLTINIRGRSTAVPFPTTRSVTNLWSNTSLVLWPGVDIQANPGQSQHFEQGSQQPGASNTSWLQLRQPTYAHRDRCHYALSPKQFDVTSVPKVCFQLFYRWFRQTLISEIAFQSHRSKGVTDLGLNTKTEKKSHKHGFIQTNSPSSLNQTTKEYISHIPIWNQD